MSMENHGGKIWIGETSYSSTRVLWQTYQQSFSSDAGGTGEVNYEFFLTK
jgi:hypothetical protein